MAAAAGQGALASVGARSEVGDVAREVQDVVSTAEPTGLGFMALSLGGGAIVSQEISDAVREAAGMSVAPQTMREFAADAGIKTVVALVAAAASRRATGFPMVLLVLAAAGAVTNAGVAAFNALQRSGFLAEAPIARVHNVASDSGSSRQSAEAGLWD